MRGTSFAALVVLVASTAYTQTPGQGGQRAEPLALAAHSEQEVPAEITEALLQELRRIFLAAGLEPEWHRMPGMIEITSVWEPVSIYLHGDCRLRGAQSDIKYDGGLAYVERTDGELRPHIHVDCGKIAAFMHQGITSFNLQRADLTMGRAMARIIAHELFHYLTKNPDHGDSELFASAVDCQVLLKAHADFLAKEVGELRKATGAAREAREKLRQRAVAGDD